jgi:hypothetical protein
MQKPIRVLKDHEPLAEPQQANLAGALRAALLLLPEAFSDFQLFAAVASLSYRGDFRMTFGAENPRKVTNIVQGNLPHFHALYSPAVLAAVPSLVATGADRTRCVPACLPVCLPACLPACLRGVGTARWARHDGAHHPPPPIPPSPPPKKIKQNHRFSQDMHPATRAELIDRLPAAVRRQLALRRPANQPWAALPAGKTTKMVKLAIHSVVARSSLAQGFKGIWTAGVLKAAAYAMRKVGKGLAGKGVLR